MLNARNNNTDPLQDHHVNVQVINKQANEDLSLCFVE